VGSLERLWCMDHFPGVNVRILSDAHARRSVIGLA